MGADSRARTDQTDLDETNVTATSILSTTTLNYNKVIGKHDIDAVLLMGGNIRGGTDYPLGSFFSLPTCCGSFCFCQSQVRGTRHKDLFSIQLLRVNACYMPGAPGQVTSSRRCFGRNRSRRLATFYLANL